MSQTSLHPDGAPTYPWASEAQATGLLTVVGTSNQVSDQSDATYVELWSTDHWKRDMLDVHLDPLLLTGDLVSASLTVRCSAGWRTDAGTDYPAGRKLRVEADLSVGESGDTFAGNFGTAEDDYSIAVAPDGVIRTLEFPLQPEADSSRSLADTLAALRGGAHMQIYTGDIRIESLGVWVPDHWVRVYEVAVNVVVTTPVYPELPGLRRIDPFTFDRWDYQPNKYGRSKPFGRDRIMVQADGHSNVRLNAAGVSDRRVLADGGADYTGFFHRIDDDTLVSIDTRYTDYVYDPYRNNLVAGVWRSDDTYDSPIFTRFGRDRNVLFPTVIFDPSHLPSNWDSQQSAQVLGPSLYSVGDFWRRGGYVYGTIQVEGSYFGGNSERHYQSFLIRFQVANDGHTILPDLDFLLPLSEMDNERLSAYSFPLDENHFAVHKIGNYDLNQNNDLAVHDTVRVYDYSGNLVHETEPLYAKTYHYDFSTGVQTGVYGRVDFSGCRDGSIVAYIATDEIVSDTFSGGRDEVCILTAKRLHWNGSGFDVVAQRELARTRSSGGAWIESFYEFAPERFITMFVLPTTSVGYVTPQRQDMYLHVQVLDGSFNITHEYVAPTKQFGSEITTEDDYRNFYSNYSQNPIPPMVTRDGNGVFGWVYSDELGEFPSYNDVNSLFVFSLDGIGTETDPPIKVPQTRLEFGPQLGDGISVGTPAPPPPTTHPLTLGLPREDGPAPYMGTHNWPNPQAIYGNGSLTDGSDSSYVTITSISDPAINSYGAVANWVSAPLSWTLPDGASVKRIRWTARVSSTGPAAPAGRYQDHSLRVLLSPYTDPFSGTFQDASVSVLDLGSGISEVSGYVDIVELARITGHWLSATDFRVHLTASAFLDDGTGTFKPAQGTWTINVYEMTFEAVVHDPSGASNPWNDTSDETYVRLDADSNWHDGIVSVVSLPPEADWHKIKRIDISVKARSTVVTDPGQESYDFYITPITGVDWEIGEDSMTRVSQVGEVSTWSITLTDEVMRNVDSWGYYMPHRLTEDGRYFAGPTSEFDYPTTLEAVTSALVDGVLVEVYPNYGVVDILDVEFKVFLPGTRPVNKAHHGSKVIRYTAGPVPVPADPQEIVAPNSLDIPGPATAEQGDFHKHLGVFAIDWSHRSIAAQFQIASPERPIWANLMVEYFSVDSQGIKNSLGRNQMMGLVLNKSTEWTEVNLAQRPRADATHWSMSLDMFADADRTERLPQGTHVYLDCIYVPDNGLDPRAHNQPYLDGDQPGAYWEGEDWNSTSTYGAKPESPMVRLDDDLTIPETQPSSE